MERWERETPAVFCRKVITSSDKFEMWGDGLQTLSLTLLTNVSRVFYCSRLTKSDIREPVNIGSNEMVSMNEIAEIVRALKQEAVNPSHSRTRGCTWSKLRQHSNKRNARLGTLNET